MERMYINMSEKIKDFVIDSILESIANKLLSVKENYEWKKLFLNAGEFLITSPDKLASFETDLYAMFSEGNMNILSKKLRNERGYDFPKVLHDEVYGLLIQYDMPLIEAESYTHHFSQIIIDYLEKHDDNKALELYLGEWKREDENNYETIRSMLNIILDKIEDLKKIEILPYSIADIDAKIRKESIHKGMSLDFFQVDDEQFESRFHELINNERIFVVGKSREETTYRILNELRNKYYDRETLIIFCEDEWKKLEQSALTGCILIPFFYSESIMAISNNTNIFVYGEDEPCYSNNKLVLRRRTQLNIIHSLEEIGIEANDAYNLVQNTHGLYVPMKKKLFGYASHNNPEWRKSHSGAVMAALLCGKWTEADGDKLIFEDLSGESYDDAKKELMEYMRIENPYVVEVKSHRGNNIQLASVEDAWEELDQYISIDIWDKFVDLLYMVLIESEPIFDYPFDKHFEASIYAKKPDWSPALKSGMIRSLTMYANYRGHDEYQHQIDDVVEKILETISTKERWGYISQYITDLCEASPKSVMKKLENELINSTGLIDLFRVNDGDILTARHYYTNILWAIEQMLQQKMYVTRAVKWLWIINEYNIKYSISNSPKSILETIFCAWINVCSLTVENKINLAQKAVENYSRAWEIIASKLPSGGSSVCSTLNTPKYRQIDEPDILYRNDINRTYIEYLWICINSINCDVSKWMKIIEHLHYYEIGIQKKVLEVLVDACSNYSDSDKTKIKEKIRYIVYRHRYNVDSAWSMEEQKVGNYENILSMITTNEKEYEYLYLFTSKYEFPLLHPVPYNREDTKLNARNLNEELRKNEIEKQMDKFIADGCSIERLVKLAIEEDNSNLGNILAEFYNKGEYDKNIENLILKYDDTGKYVYEYISWFYYKGVINLKNILSEIREKSTNVNLFVNLILLECIDSTANCIIANESEEIKKIYWSRYNRFLISEKADSKVCIWALNECARYGTLESYIKLLFDLKERIDINQLFEYLFKIVEMSGGNGSMTDYYLREILDMLQNSFMDNFEKCQKIAQLEWMCRNILDWNQMKCLQYVMKEDPHFYAELVKIIYKSDKEDETISQEKRKLANKIYSGFSKAKFCPTEKEGIVHYDKLKEWILKFWNILNEQCQVKLFDSLLGELLAYSPVGQDGYMPCEAVRRVIEEYHSDSIKNAYIIAEENKRGVHICDAGKSEMLLSQKYKENAEVLQESYPYTAEIYFELSKSYKQQADWERRHAEDEY